MTSSSRPSEQVWPTRVNSALQDAASDRPVDAQTLLEDLRIHQVELEMQAQALRASEARAQAESLRLQHLLAEVPVALVRIDGLGRTVAINRAAESLLGQPSTQMEGKPLHRLGADQHERSRLMHAINQGLRSTRHLSRGHQFLLQGQLCTLDLHMSQVPGFSEGGQSEWLVSLVDQSEVVRQNAQQEQTLEELKLSLALNRDLASVTDAMPDMVAVCTADADVDRKSHV